MKQCRYFILFFLISFSAFAGSESINTRPVVKNIITSLNYNKYDNFLKDGSLKWRKYMNRGRYNKLRTEMLSYIGHIVGWKFVSLNTKGKLHNFTYKLFGENENIGLHMRIQVYKHNNKVLVNNVVFLKR